MRSVSKIMSNLRYALLLVWVPNSILSLIAFAPNLLPHDCLPFTSPHNINFSSLILMNFLFCHCINISHVSQVLNLSLGIIDSLFYFGWKWFLQLASYSFFILEIKLKMYVKFIIRGLASFWVKFGDLSLSYIINHIIYVSLKYIFCSSHLHRERLYKNPKEDRNIFVSYSQLNELLNGQEMIKHHLN